VIFFPIYAALVWYGCFRWRRRPQAFLSILAGLTGVAIFSELHAALNRLLDGGWSGHTLRVMLIAEAAIILLVGGYLAVLPQGRVHLPCRRCRYELRGLEHENPTCPECGLPHAVRKVRVSDTGTPAEKPGRAA